MNTSWIIVAFMLSVFFCGGEAGWKDHYGVAGSVPVAMAATTTTTNNNNNKNNDNNTYNDNNDNNNENDFLIIMLKED